MSRVLFQNVAFLLIIIQNVIMLSAIMLSVVMLNAMARNYRLEWMLHQYLTANIRLARKTCQVKRRKDIQHNDTQHA